MRYFFDLRDSDSLAVDQEGIELPSMARAQEEAASSLAGMAMERVLEAVQGDAEYLAVEVRDQDGPLMIVHFIFTTDPTRH
jgi:hypothetical protein